MEKGAANGLELSIDLPLLSESLRTLADDVEFIAGGAADDCSDYDAWERRTSAGLQLTRIRSMLNGGELDLAAVELSTLRTLRNVWLTIKHFDYGSHYDDPASYRGPLFLPHELGPHASTGLKVILRTADERFDKYEDFPGYEKLDRDDFLATINEVRATLDPPREPLNIEWTTTKREQWSYLPEELRRYAGILSASATPAAQRERSRDAEKGPSANELTPDQIAASIAGDNATSNQPNWNDDDSILTFRGGIVRKVRRTAKNVRSVLNAFQELGWPRRIDDPLPGGKDQARVNDTVASLNTGLTPPLTFQADGTGAGYSWTIAGE